MAKTFTVLFTDVELEEVSRALVGHLYDLSIEQTSVHRYRDLVPMPEHEESFNITKCMYEKMLELRFGGIKNG